MKLDHLKRQRNHAQAALDKLTDIVLADIVRRNEQPAANDGYPRQTLNLNGSGGTSTDTTVEANALRGLPDDSTPDDWAQHDHANDHMSDAIRQLADALTLADKAATEIDRNLGMIQHAHDKVPDPETITSPDGHCEACTRWVSGSSIDRRKAGYCQACYQAWWREGRPDRAAFEASRRGEHTAAQHQAAAVTWLDKATHRPVTLITGVWHNGQDWTPAMIEAALAAGNLPDAIAALVTQEPQANHGA